MENGSYFVQDTQISYTKSVKHLYKYLIFQKNKVQQMLK